jgi:hypothetical protein
MADIEAAKPTVDDVALLLRTRTVGYQPPTVGQLGGDTGPSDVTTFSDTTRPTAVEVQALIETSYDAMIGRLDATLIASQYEAFSHVVALMINDALAGIRLAIGREEPITGAQTGFGTLVIGTTMTGATAPPEPDWMPGIDF